MSNSSAVVQATVQLGNNGVPKSEQVDVLEKSSNRDLFKAAVETVLKASEFSEGCKGVTVRLTFRFRMGSADAVWFAYPGTYEITALPPLLNKAGR